VDEAMSVILYDLCAADARRRFSPHCWKAKMALAHKRIAFETLPVPFTRIKEIAGGFSPTLPILDDNGHLVRDSWDIAVYLEEKYPEAPTLFGGPGGKASAKFVEGWALGAIHPAIFPMIARDIHDILDPADKEYFRESREKRLGRTLETAQENRAERVEHFRQVMMPLRLMLKTQPWIGGEGPLFADYLAFGPLQWARVASAFPLLDAANDPVVDWFERCLDRHDGIGHAMHAAA
jgi:glutathione S-transferase